MTAQSEHMLCGIARYEGCKQALTFSQGYYRCIPRIKKACEDIQACTEPRVIHAEALEAQVIQIIRRFSLPTFASDRLAFEAWREEQRLLKKTEKPRREILAELHGVAEDLRALAPRLRPRTKRFDKAAALMIRGTDTTLQFLMFENNRRGILRWLRTIALVFGERLLFFLEEPQLTNTVSLTFDYVYVSNSKVTSFTLSPLFRYAFLWLKREVGIPLPVPETPKTAYDELSIPEMVKYLSDRQIYYLGQVGKPPSHKHRQRKLKGEETCRETLKRQQDFHLHLAETYDFFASSATLRNLFGLPHDALLSYFDPLEECENHDPRNSQTPF